MSDNLNRIELNKKYENRTNNIEEEQTTKPRDDVATGELIVKLLKDQLANEQKENSGLKMMLQLAENWEKENKLLKNELKRVKACLKKQNLPLPPQLQERKNQNEQLTNRIGLDAANQTWGQRYSNYKSQTQPFDNPPYNADVNYWSMANVCFDTPIKDLMLGRHVDCTLAKSGMLGTNNTQTKCQECKNKNMIISQYEQKIAEYNDELIKMKSALQSTLAEKNEIDEKFQIMNIQLEIYKSDFQTERKDRENAMDRLATIERQLLTKKEEAPNNRVPCYAIQPNTYPGGRNIDLNRFNIAQQSDDILIGRGASNAACANYCVTNKEPDENHGQKFSFAPPNKSKNNVNDSKNRIPENELHDSNSSESLNLLPAEFGGDDLCLWETKSKI